MGTVIVWETLLYFTTLYQVPNNDQHQKPIITCPLHQPFTGVNEVMLALRKTEAVSSEGGPMLTAHSQSEWGKLKRLSVKAMFPLLQRSFIKSHPLTPGFHCQVFSSVNFKNLSGRI